MPGTSNPKWAPICRYGTSNPKSAPIYRYGTGDGLVGVSWNVNELRVLPAGQRHYLVHVFSAVLWINAQCVACTTNNGLISNT